ncbi:MAG: hypothetical protein HY527_15615 [Betaproteobacteria bacterium]|nr:hypothetical protein [Betaproteobacteria bacterium]
MSRTASWRRTAFLILGIAGAVAAFVFSSGSTGDLSLVEELQAADPRLISIEPLPEPMCELPGEPGGYQFQQAGFWARLPQAPVSAAAAAEPRPDDATRLAASQRKPIRVIRDPYPSYAAIAVDPANNEVILTDQNLFQILAYDRLANTPPTASLTEPKRVLGGLRSKIEFQSGVYVDPNTGEIYGVNNDTVGALVIFSRQANGDSRPNRQLYTPQSFGVAVDEVAQEIFLTDQQDASVVVWKKTASENDEPIRLLQGDRTGLQDPHGIAVDSKNRLLFVTNHGDVHQKVPGGRLTSSPGGGRSEGKKNWPVGQHIPGSGQSLPPSITVHALDAQGDTPPLRTIQGDQTQLNWPTGVTFDPKRNEIIVANDGADSILVFSAAASGDVAPLRVLKGPKSLIKNPTGVAIDTKNDELWVANYGNHTATVYPPTATGDTPPLRLIRSSPLNRPALIIGNPGALAFDSRREEILVPN